MTIRAAIAAFLLAGVSGCVESESVQTSSTAGRSYEAFLASAYLDPYGVYVMNGDVPVLPAQMRRRWAAEQQGALIVDSEGGVDSKWPANLRKNLRYCISNDFGVRKAAVQEALKEATENGWEKMADVDFIHDTTQDATCNRNNGNVAFDVSPVNANGAYIARAFFPGFPRADRNVLIDPSAFSPQLTWPLKNILAHELGHVLGLRHEHTRPEGADQCFEDTNYRALTAYDAASVMHYPQCGGTSRDLAFTNRDREGIVVLYGKPVVNVAPIAQFTSPTEGAVVVGDALNVVANIVDMDLKQVELKVNGTTRETKTLGPFEFSLAGLAAGAYTLTLVATDTGGLVTTRELAVTLEAPKPSGLAVDRDAFEGSPELAGAGCNAPGAMHGMVWVLGLLATGRRRRRR